MTDHITVAKGAADTIDAAGLSHPISDRVALFGILHALLALHEQNAGKAPARRTTTQKADK